MKLYAEVGSFRARQILGDAALVVWVALWARVGFAVRALVDRLAGPARTLEDAGAGFARPFSDAGTRVADVPVVGDALQAPFEAAAGAGRALARAGAGQQEVIHALALWLGGLFALIPILFALLRYLPGRLRWARRAASAASIRLDPAGLSLFALRAVATRPFDELRRATPDPAGAWASGDHEALAALELASLGLRPHRR
ncbi:MAG TPA: hypothetical protein VHK89_10660 [Actinomycetota bacterium]|nr:hypothetical protein [Actinomycetota bacterium]